MTTWTPEVRIAVARIIAMDLMTEARRSVIKSSRVEERAELIVYVLSLPPALLDANRDKYAEWLK